ncbi:MAG: SUF system NifU family Fe-S cluster assembly protein [Rubritepida sp.]|jgi:nitrogen fixation NifU-like protein|nr:SUF system NifU family Fe-S cluster assembly protein [Rubritepida sp.]MCU0944929.1 SUF system NifU family Fe-S cluster assembly protein [Rubritepida sp.]
MAEAADFEALRDLYQEVILDHGRKPRNHFRLEVFDASARGDNPMCGDRVEVFLKLDDAGRIARASFLGRGCAVSQASASLLTELVPGKTKDEARALGARLRAMARTGARDDSTEDLARLSALSGVHEFPSRVKCATLAWHALDAALDGAKEASSE